jgi:hypothetical protein
MSGCKRARGNFAQRAGNILRKFSPDNFHPGGRYQGILDNKPRITNNESRLSISIPVCLDNYGSRWYIISNYIQAVKRRVHKGFGKESSGGWEGVRKVYGTWPLSLSAEQ